MCLRACCVEDAKFMSGCALGWRSVSLLKLYANLSLCIWEEALLCSSTYQRSLRPNSSTWTEAKQHLQRLNSLAFIFKLTLNVNQTKEKGSEV